MERFSLCLDFFMPDRNCRIWNCLLLWVFIGFKKTNVRYFFIDTFKVVVVFYGHGL